MSPDGRWSKGEWGSSDLCKSQNLWHILPSSAFCLTHLISTTKHLTKEPQLLKNLMVKVPSLLTKVTGVESSVCTAMVFLLLWIFTTNFHNSLDNCEVNSYCEYFIFCQSYYCLALTICPSFLLIDHIYTQMTDIFTAKDTIFKDIYTLLLFLFLLFVRNLYKYSSLFTIIWLAAFNFLKCKYAKQSVDSGPQILNFYIFLS